MRDVRAPSCGATGGGRAAGTGRWKGARALPRARFDRSGPIAMEHACPRAFPSRQKGIWAGARRSVAGWKESGCPVKLRVPPLLQPFHPAASGACLPNTGESAPPPAPCTSPPLARAAGALSPPQPGRSRRDVLQFSSSAAWGVVRGCLAARWGTISRAFRLHVAGETRWPPAGHAPRPLAASRWRRAGRGGQQPGPESPILPSHTFIPFWP